MVVEPISIAPHAVLCFFQDVIAGAVERHGGRIVDHGERSAATRSTRSTTVGGGWW